MRCHHQHRRLLQVSPPTFDLHPQEPQGEEDSSAQPQDDAVEEPVAPARDWPRAFLLGQAGQSEPGERPRDEEEESSQGEAQGEKDAAQDDALATREGQ